MGHKRWTKEDESFLIEHWGHISIPSLCQKLNRSKAAIKVRVCRMGLPPFLESGDYISLNQLHIAVTGTENGGSYFMKSWVKNRGLPVHDKRIDNCTWHVVYLDEFWRWADKNRGFLDFSKMDPLILGKEPGWVVEQRSKDFFAFAAQRKDPWTPVEDSRLKYLLKQHRYGYLEISEQIKRSAGAIQRRICDLGLRERPVKAETHIAWTQEDFNILASGIRAGDSYMSIGALVGRSEKAVRGRVYEVYRTENADKVRIMLGSGAWGDGAPELTVWDARRKANVKSQMSRMVELLLIRKNQLGYDPYWQRQICMKWHDIKGCTAGESNCDECIQFERIRLQYCARCGGSFLEREENRICPPCRQLRKKAAQRKWAVMHKKHVG